VAEVSVATVIIEEEEERSEGRRKIDNSVSYVMRTIDAILAVMSTMIYTWSKAHVRLMSFL
jgi:hypothetical protein